MHHAHSVVKIGLTSDNLLGGADLPPPPGTYRVNEFGWYNCDSGDNY